MIRRSFLWAGFGALVAPLLHRLSPPKLAIVDDVAISSTTFVCKMPERLVFHYGGRDIPFEIDEYLPDREIYSMLRRSR